MRSIIEKVTVLALLGLAGCNAVDVSEAETVAMEHLGAGTAITDLQPAKDNADPRRPEAFCGTAKQADGQTVRFLVSVERREVWTEGEAIQPIADLPPGAADVLADIRSETFGTAYQVRCG